MLLRVWTMLLILQESKYKSSIQLNISDFSSIGSLAAAYIFTNPAMAKYLCQFVDTAVSFVNHIPTKLLCKSQHPLHTNQC